jgi:hypothetical protein
MISQQEEDEIRRFHEAMQRILRSKDPDPEGIAYVRSQSERIKELERRLMEERREEQRREESKEAEERVPHQPHQVIWLTAGMLRNACGLRLSLGGNGAEFIRAWLGLEAGASVSRYLRKEEQGALLPEISL